MAYGKIKADTLIYDNSGSDVEVTLSSLGNKADLASPTFTGTVTIPTPSSGDNTTKAASTAYVQTELGDYLTTATATSTYAPKASPALTGTATGVNLTLSGDLTVNGTTTTINSTTLAVDDKNIELGTVDTPSDTTADGGGITLKGATDKTFNWVDSTDAWTSSEHIHVGDDKKLIIGTGSDLQIYHSSNESKIINQTGSIWLQTDNGIRFTDHGLNQSMAAFYDNGACELYHNGTKKIETTATGVTVSGSVTDDKGDLRTIPQIAKTATHTLVAADAGKHVSTNSSVTIPPSVFSAGHAITIYNSSGTDIPIYRGTGVTLYQASDGANANRTLGTKGLATILCVASDTFVISGAGLS